MHLYLHGFASSPQSAKAQFFRDRWAEQGVSLQVPDLNQGDFTHLTLTRQIQQVCECLESADSATLIGSSLGGLTAAWVAAQLSTQIRQLILLAPAFQFLDHWLPRLGEAQVRQWQTDQFLLVHHYGEGRSRPLHYGFIEDARRYDETQLHPRVPTLICHGRADEVIPIQASRWYAARNPGVMLLEFDSDHGLTGVQPAIWQAIQAFLENETSLAP